MCSMLAGAVRQTTDSPGLTAESLPVDDYPPVGTVGHGLVAFLDSELKRDGAPAAVGDDRPGPHHPPDLRCFDMVQHGMGTDRGSTGRKVVRDGRHCGLLGKRQHPGCAKHRNIAGAVGDGGIAVTDNQRNLCC